MSRYSKQLIINKYFSSKLPKDIIYIINDYIFDKIKKISKDDIRYKILNTIPLKEYDSNDDIMFIYISINDNKDYYLTYRDFRIQLQTLLYVNTYRIHVLEAHNYQIK